MSDEDSYINAIYNDGRDQGLEEAAQVVDTACCADESLRKLAAAIRDLKSE
jgi:hypothetical protein